MTSRLVRNGNAMKEILSSCICSRRSLKGLTLLEEIAELYTVIHSIARGDHTTCLFPDFTTPNGHFTILFNFTMSTSIHEGHILVFFFKWSKFKVLSSCQTICLECSKILVKNVATCYQCTAQHLLVSVHLLSRAPPLTTKLRNCYRQSMPPCKIGD